MIWFVISMAIYLTLMLIAIVYGERKQFQKKELEINKKIESENQILDFNEILKNHEDDLKEYLKDNIRFF